MRVEYKDGSFIMYYSNYTIKTAFQGIYCKDGDIYGYEALIRVYDDITKEYIPPPVFIDEISNPYSLEAFYLINKLHLFNFKKLIKTNSNLKLFVNITPSFFDSLGGNLKVQAMVCQLMNEAGIGSESLIAEILESESSQYPNFNAGISFIKSINVAIALDDFGEENSNIERYKEVNPKIVKISREFYLESFKSLSTIEILRNVITLFKKDGVKVVVEGLENHKHINQLISMGVDLYQGFVIHKPEIYTKDFQYRIPLSFVDINNEFVQVG